MTIAARLDRVCIVLMSAAGDVVHALPVVCAIKRAAPACKITWILQPVPASLVRGHECVDDIIEFDRSLGVRAFADIRRKLAGREFDLVIDLQVYFKAGIVTALTHAKVKLGFDHKRARDLNWLFTNAKIPPQALSHVQDQYFEFLTALGVDRDPIEWKLGPWDEEREWQRGWRARFDRPVAAIVVATSKPAKDWIPERWAAVSDALYQEYGMQPVLVGGRSPRELDAERRINAVAAVTPRSELGSGMRKLVSILDSSSLVLAPDTGPLHMAVALGRPVISLMGYTNPKRTGPYRYRDLLVDAYGDPGEDYQPTMENRPGRMERITVDDVLEKVRHWQSVYGRWSAGVGDRLD